LSTPDVPIPENLGARLQPLFNLDGIPGTLEELADLSRKRWVNRLHNPRVKAYFDAINSGTEVFGKVGYNTRHSVGLASGERVNVACALDAIIEGLFRPVEIESTCPHCGEQLKVKMLDQKIIYVEPPSMVLWLGASSGDGVSCETDACPYINLFSSREHVTDWKSKNPGELGMIMGLDQSLDLAKKGWYEVTASMEAKTGASEHRSISLFMEFGDLL